MTDVCLYNTIIIDSGVLMDARLFGTWDDAAKFILDYLNDPDERKKSGRQQKLISYQHAARWLGQQESLFACIIKQVVRIR